MTRRTMTSYVLVGIQMACLLYFFYRQGVWLSDWWLRILFMLSLIPAIWAFITMGYYRFSIFPDPKPHTELITRGPYKLIRHPMYTTLILIGICYVIDELSLINIMVFVLLVVNLLLKIHVEEKALRHKFSAYIQYSQRTYRILPFLY